MDRFSDTRGEEYYQRHQSKYEDLFSMDFDTLCRLAHLNTTEKDLVSLYFQHDWTHEAIGREIGITRQAVAKRLQTIYRNMHNALN